MNQDRLYLALTRPAMLFGVPMEAACLSMLTGGLAMILGDSIAYLILIVPLLAMSHVIVKRDQNAFRILFRFFDTGAKCRNRAHWGGASSSPLRIRQTYNIEDID